VLKVSGFANVELLEAVTSLPLGATLATSFLLTAEDAGGQEVTAFAAPITLELRAEASTFATQPAAAQLALVRWDGTRWVWQPADLTQNGDGSVTARASTTSFSLWAIMAQPADPFFGVQPPPGGVAMLVWRGISGTPAGTAAGLIDGLSTLFQFDIATQRWSRYVIGAPAIVSENFLTENGGIVTVRAKGNLGVTPAPTTPGAGATPTVFPRKTVNVLPGENLTDVASRVNVSFGLLAALNGLVGPQYGITPGQALFIEPPLQQTVVVQPGEALIDIALRTNVNFDLLATLNGLVGPAYAIAPGQMLFIEAPPP
jgi:LysM repeat protein